MGKLESERQRLPDEPVPTLHQKMDGDMGYPDDEMRHPESHQE